MSTQIGRVLADGVAQGKGPLEIARQMSKEVKGITKKRAIALARTEIIHAHAEAQLDGFEELGVKKVGARVEFLDSSDDLVCPRCKKLNGKVFTIKQARGVIPVHVFCRCSWGIVIELPKGFKPKRRR